MQVRRDLDDSGYVSGEDMGYTLATTGELLAVVERVNRTVRDQHLTGIVAPG